MSQDDLRTKMVNVRSGKSLSSILMEHTILKTEMPTHSE